jgi:hypothetical protein
MRDFHTAYKTHAAAAAPKVGHTLTYALLAWAGLMSLLTVLTVAAEGEVDRGREPEYNTQPVARHQAVQDTPHTEHGRQP